MWAPGAHGAVADGPKEEAGGTAQGSAEEALQQGVTASHLALDLSAANHKDKRSKWVWKWGDQLRRFFYQS